MFKFHFEIEKLREILLSNGYSNKFIDKCISKFMHKFLKLQKPVTLTVPKKQLYLVLPFMGKMSALVKSGLIRSLHERLPFSNVKIVFKTSNRLKNYFSFKDIVPELLRSCQIYNFKIIFKTSSRLKNYFSFKYIIPEPLRSCEIYNFKIVFKTSNRWKNYFSFKYIVPEPLRFCRIYNFTCRSCNASYTGKTFEHMKVRVSEN